MIEPYYEYSLPRLVEECGVPAQELLKAIERQELPARKGPGRKGEWRILGARYIEWQESRHPKVKPAESSLEPRAAVELLQAIQDIRKRLESDREPAVDLPPDILSPEEAAKYLNVSGATLRRWKSDGLIQCMRIGNVTRYRKDWLDEFIRDQSLR